MSYASAVPVFEVGSDSTPNFQACTGDLASCEELHFLVCQFFVDTVADPVPQDCKDVVSGGEVKGSTTCDTEEEEKENHDGAGARRSRAGPEGTKEDGGPRDGRWSQF